MAVNYSVVVPGDSLGERNGRKLGSGVYIEGEQLFSSVLGVAKVTENEAFVIPSSGVYMPRGGDMIIGRVKSVEVSGWFIDVNSPYLAFMPLSDATEEFLDTTRVDMSNVFSVNDLIYCKISKVTMEKNVRVSMIDRMARKLETGVIINVVPTKVPRIIGKEASMLKLIKTNTGCNILVGQNGRIWIDGKDKAKAIEAILIIEKESHIEGLTERIEKLLGG